MELKDPLACDSSLVQIEALDGFETDPEVKHETMEFDFINPSMELVNPAVSNESEPFSCNDIVEEDTVYESSELIHGEELPEDSTIAPMVIESSQSSLNEDILEEDSLVYESCEVFPDRELVEESATRPTVQDKELLEESSIAPPVVESSYASSDKEVSEEESLIAPPESTQDEGVLEDESEYTDDDDEEVEVSEDESES
ncbi:hypothetical protein Tco_0225833, partial [Tanacetum coccineum]